MRSYLKYLSLLVPLAVLLSLPCATKRLIKEKAGVPATEIATNKGESAKLCITTLVEKEQVQYTLKRLITDVPAVSFTNLIRPVFATIKKNIVFKGVLDEVSAIPLFLLYKKLIIYF